MGLKTDIENAFLKNIEPPGGWEDGEPTDAGKTKVSELAQDLENAIVNFLTNPEMILRVKKLTASVHNVPVVTPTGPGVAAAVTVGVDEDGAKPDNLIGGGTVESMTSEVVLKESDVKKSGALG